MFWVWEGKTCLTCKRRFLQTKEHLINGKEITRKRLYDGFESLRNLETNFIDSLETL